MIVKYPADSRFHAENDWVRSAFSFSFGPYNDIDNSSFGPMRVLNDDYVKARQGFGAHPHSDMEVVSIVLSGQMRHEDNLGNVGITSWGEVQRMTAGNGIIHTEFNASEFEELNLLQMWFMPSKRGLQPSYEITRFDPNSLNGQWLPVVAQHPAKDVAEIHQDMTIYLSELAPLQTLTFSTVPERRVLLFVISGEISVLDGDTLENAKSGPSLLGARDSARITQMNQLRVMAVQNSRMILIDLP